MAKCTLLQFPQEGFMGIIFSGILSIANCLSVVFVPGSAFGQIKNPWFIVFSLEDCLDHCLLMFHVTIVVEKPKFCHLLQ